MCWFLSYYVLITDQFGWIKLNQGATLSVFIIAMPVIVVRCHLHVTPLVAVMRNIGRLQRVRVP